MRLVARAPRLSSREACLCEQWGMVLRALMYVGLVDSVALAAGGSSATAALQ